MRSTILLATAVMSAFWIAAAPAPDDRPKQIVERALAAVGGKEAQRKTRTSRTLVKGKLQELGDATFEAVVLTDYPDRFHYTAKGRMPDGVRIQFTIVLNRDKGWFKFNEELEELSAADILDLRQALHADLAATLAPLVDDPKYTLSAAGEIKIEGKPAQKIKVAYPDQPDVLLAFDRGSGLLVKMEQKRKDPQSGKEILHETLLSDYRAVDSTDSAAATLQEAKIAQDGATLLRHLKEQTVPIAERVAIRQLVARLGDASFEEREKAKTALLAKGAKAWPWLERASQSKDPEVASQARECLGALGASKPDTKVAAAVIRSLVKARPADAVPVLGAYLASAPGEHVEQEIKAALVELGYHDGKPTTELSALGQDADPHVKAVVAGLLAKDPKEAASQAGTPLYVQKFQQATRRREFKDGKLASEAELVDRTFFSGLDAGAFRKP